MGTSLTEEPSLRRAGASPVTRVTFMRAVSNASTDASGLSVTVIPSLDGVVRKTNVYDASLCRVQAHVYSSPVPLTAGTPTPLSMGGTYPAGLHLLITVEGVDTGIATPG